VLRTIKQRWPEVEVIVITGHAALDTAKQSVALGAFDYLAKPVGPEDVIKVTHDALLHKGWALRADRRPAAGPVQ
jgi:DNA-binding NtrC family response regulator